MQNAPHQVKLTHKQNQYADWSDSQKCLSNFFCGDEWANTEYVWDITFSGRSALVLDDPGLWWNHPRLTAAMERRKRKGRLPTAPMRVAEQVDKVMRRVQDVAEEIATKVHKQTQMQGAETQAMEETTAVPLGAESMERL